MCSEMCSKTRRLSSFNACVHHGKIEQNYYTVRHNIMHICCKFMCAIYIKRSIKNIHMCSLCARQRKKAQISFKFIIIQGSTTFTSNNVAPLLLNTYHISEERILIYNKMWHRFFHIT